MSKEVVTLAADLAAVKGVSSEIAVQDLASFFAGSTETMRKYGVIILESEVVSRALLDTHKETADQLTQEEKQLARYNLLMEKTANIQGQATRESRNYKAQLADLKNIFDDLQLKIGQKLIPVVTEIISKVNDFFDSTKGKQILDDLTSGIGNIADAALKFIQSGDMKNFIDTWLPKITNFAADMIDKLPGIAKIITEKGPEVLQTLGETAENIAILIENVNGFFDAMKYGSEDAGAREAFNTVREQVKKLADSVGLNFGNMKAVIADYAITNKVKLEDIYNNWGTYEPLIVEYIQNAKEETILSTDAMQEKMQNFANDNGITLDSLVEQYQSWKNRTQENEGQINEDLEACAEANGLKLDEVEGFFVDMSSTVETEMQKSGDSVAKGMEKIGNVDMTGPNNLRNTVRSWASDIQTAVANALNWIDKINSDAVNAGTGWGAGATGPSWGIGKGLQDYASGGFPTVGQLFYAREGGKTEMVGSIGSQTAVANNQQIVEGITEGVYNAMMAANANSGGQAGITIIQIDGKEIGRAVNKYNANRGIPIFGGSYGY